MPAHFGPAAAAAPLLEAAAALLRQRRPVAAEAMLETAPALVARAPAWALLQGVVQTRLGRIERACRLLLPLTGGAEPWATEAASALADAYHFAHRHDDLRQLLKQGLPWAGTPRGALFQARLLAASDPEQALAMLLALVDSLPAGDLWRIAGFDAVKLLDRSARYRQAFELATRLHAAAPAFDRAAFEAAVQQQLRLLAKGAGWCRARAEPVDKTAFVIGLPRSGTTLLEQMLDCHPAVAGIGEHEGIGDLAAALVAAGVWPYRLNHLPAEAAQAMQQQYSRSARRRAPGPAVWTVDKSLMTWRWLPAVASVLPGAVGLYVLREPRDMAISTFLSYFDPVAFGWTAGLETIRHVIAAERALLALARQTLALPQESVVYEALVADPRSSLQRCLARMGLPMDERVLAPENNQRTAMTLSHEQVRRPINDASIGRWQHYAFAFDGAWEALAQAHAGLRAGAAH